MVRVFGFVVGRQGETTSRGVMMSILRVQMQNLSLGDITNLPNYQAEKKKEEEEQAEKNKTKQQDKNWFTKIQGYVSSSFDHAAFQRRFLHQAAEFLADLERGGKLTWPTPSALYEPPSVTFRKLHARAMLLNGLAGPSAASLR